MVQYFPIVTGSLTVTGSVLVSGSITTNSTITATTLVVQTITSSISAITGSTNFGSLSSNTHTFTGSLLVSGSTSFAGNVELNGPSGNRTLTIQTNTSGSPILTLSAAGSNGGSITYDRAASEMVFSNSGVSNALRITAAGAAIFSSTVDGTIFNSTSNAFRLNGNNALSLVTLNAQSVVKINAAGFWGVQLVGANDSGIVINNIGNVGIGTTSPADGLTIETNSNNYNALALRDSRAFNTSPEAALAFRLKYNSAGAYATPALFVAYKDNTTDGNQAGGIAFYTNPNSNVNERMRITSSGKIGMGVTNPEYLLDVADSSSNTLMAVRNTNTASSTAKNAMYGFLGTDTVGTVKAVGGMQAVTNDVNWISGNLYWYVRSGDAQPLRMSLSSGGALVISGALTQNGSPSDINLKENLVKISSPLNKISQINGYTFEWKEGTPARGNISNIVEDAGVVAQEIETILPEIVRTSDDNKVVNYNGITALLIEAIKELNTKFEEYKATHP